MVFFKKKKKGNFLEAERDFTKVAQKGAQNTMWTP